MSEVSRAGASGRASGSTTASTRAVAQVVTELGDLVGVGLLAGPFSVMSDIHWVSAVGVEPYWPPRAVVESGPTK